MPLLPFNTAHIRHAWMRRLGKADILVIMREMSVLRGLTHIIAILDVLLRNWLLNEGLVVWHKSRLWNLEAGSGHECSRLGKWGEAGCCRCHYNGGSKRRLLWLGYLAQFWELWIVIRAWNTFLQILRLLTDLPKTFWDFSGSEWIRFSECFGLSDLLGYLGALLVLSKGVGGGC